MVCLFSLCWGVGSFLFGLVVKYLGLALGTSLLLGVVLVLGTLLPLLYSSLDQAGSWAFLLTLIGVAFGIVGFTLSAVAGTFISVGGGTKRSEELYDTSIAEEGAACRSMQIEVSIQEDCVERRQPIVQARTNSSRYKGLFVGLLGGVFASMLQFAFVFGKPLLDEAESVGISSVNASQPVWLLAFCCGAVANLTYPSYLLYSKVFLSAQCILLSFTSLSLD